MTKGYRQPTSQERALLNALRFGEGTAGENGYRTMFGGGLFDPSKGHPDRVVRSGGYASAAAGAYQFMPDTWNEWAPKSGVDPRDFSPGAQDAVALNLIYGKRGVKPEEVAAGLTPQLVAKLAPEWASLPKLDGKSYYNQPVKSFTELKKVYDRHLENGGGPTAAHMVKPQAPDQRSSGAAPVAPVDTGAGTGGAGFDDGMASVLGLIASAGSSLGGPLETATRFAGDPVMATLLSRFSPSSSAGRVPMWKRLLEEF